MCYWNQNQNRKKTQQIKIKDGNPSIKSIRQMKTQIDTTKRKKQKQKKIKIR